MTQEFIAALRQRQKDREKFIHDQRESLKSWDEDNLDPYVKSCDHTYPWGDSAWRGANSIPDDYKTCQICYKTHYGR